MSETNAELSRRFVEKVSRLTALLPYRTDFKTVDEGVLRDAYGLAQEAAGFFREMSGDSRSHAFDVWARELSHLRDSGRAMGYTAVL